MIIDLAKRKTLVTLGGSALVTALPSLSAAAVVGNSALQTEIKQPRDTLVSLSDSTYELSISLLVDDQPTVKITNNSDKLVIVRHIYPGIVHTGEKTFDLNSLFDKSAYAIGAGKSRSIPIVETVATQHETSYPRHRAGKPLRVANLVAHVGKQTQLQQVVNSTRSIYA